MKSKLPRLLACLAPLAVFTALRADDPGSNTGVRAGASYARVEGSGISTDLAGFNVGGTFELGDFLNTDLTFAVDYDHLTASGNTVFTRDEIDADFRFGFGLIGILKPYVLAGVSVERNDAPAFTTQKDWNAGAAVGAGVGITLIPGLLHTTPSVRYVESTDLDTITYSLDTALHFTVVGVGLRLDYEDNVKQDGHVASATVYANLRF